MQHDHLRIECQRSNHINAIYNVYGVLLSKSFSLPQVFLSSFFLSNHHDFTIIHWNLRSNNEDYNWISSYIRRWHVNLKSPLDLGHFTALLISQIHAIVCAIYKIKIAGQREQDWREKKKKVVECIAVFELKSLWLVELDFGWQWRTKTIVK